jgi:CheY-like chemotaxis protein
VKEKIQSLFTTKPAGEGTPGDDEPRHRRNSTAAQSTSILRLAYSPNSPRAAWLLRRKSMRRQELSVYILVVDDEPDVEALFRQQFRRDLKAGRFTMEFAPSAPVALQRAVEIRAPSLILILSDINMPGMSGLEMLPKVRAERPDVPVIMITAYGDAETRRKAIERGAVGLLTKPIDFALLRHEIDTRLGQAA